MSLTFVITGTLSKPRDVFKTCIESLGHKVSSSVTDKTDYLLVGANPGSKLDKAEMLGVGIVSESTLDWVLNKAKRSAKHDVRPAGPATRTVYWFYTPEHGENEAMFDEDFNLLDAWSCNHSTFDPEEMAGWLSKVGIIVRELPAHRANAAIEAISDHMGYGDDFGD